MTDWEHWRRVARESPSWALAVGASLLEYAFEEWGWTKYIRHSPTLRSWSELRLVMDSELRMRQLRSL